jgi:hypothetical protein
LVNCHAASQICHDRSAKPHKHHVAIRRHIGMVTYTVVDQPKDKAGLRRGESLTLGLKQEAPVGRAR